MIRLAQFTRCITATAAAAAVAVTAVTASAAPARASSDDLLKLLAGAAAVGIIVTGLERSSRAKPRDHGRIDPAPDRHGKGLGARGRDHGQGAHGRGKGRAAHRHHRSTTAIPQHCQMRTRGNQRGESYYSPRCLRAAGLTSRTLPRQCETRMRSRNGHVRVYSGRCLRNAGFRVAGR